MVAVVAVVIVARGARSMAVATTEVVTAIATTVTPAAIAAIVIARATIRVAMATVVVGLGEINTSCGSGSCWILLVHPSPNPPLKFFVRFPKS